MLESVNHRIARGRSTYQALDEQYRKAGDNASRLRLLEENIGTLYHPEEAAVMRSNIEHDREEWDKQQRVTKAIGEIDADPFAAREKYEREAPEGEDPTEWARMRDHLRARLSNERNAIVDTIKEGIAAGKITRPNQLDEWNDELGAAAVANLKAGMAKAADAEYQRAIKLPENQALLIGQITATLDTIDPYDIAARVILEQQLDAVAEGPSKNYLREEIARKIRGEAPQAADTILKAGMEALKNAADMNDFGPVKPPAAKKVELRDALKAGWLKDIKKLQAQGFSEDQAEAIREAAREDAALGQKKFTELWKERPQQSANAAPFDVAVADAIRGENATLQWDADIPPEERAAHEQAARTYGQAVQEFQAWAARHPKASEADMNTKLRELGSRAGRVAPATTVKPPPARRDSSTSMNLPKTGIKLSNYGYKSDTTPDSYSARGIGHSDNQLIPGKSAAITKSLATRLGLKHGDKIKVETTKGTFEVYYHDTVPSYDKRTGPLPETIDIYRPQDGSNSWGGKVLNISKVS
jgi:hypothetical protein